MKGQENMSLMGSGGGVVVGGVVVGGVVVGGVVVGGVVVGVPGHPAKIRLITNMGMRSIDNPI